MNLTDGIYHRVSLYFLDWLNLGVAQTVDVLDNYSGQVLDHRVLPPFANGIYETWDVRGHVRFVLSASSGLPAMVSGLFLGVSPYLAPISINDPPGGAVFNSPASFSVRADTFADPKISRVELYQNSTLVAFATNGPPYIFALTNLSPGYFTFLVRAVSPLGSLSSQPVTVLVTPHQIIEITSLTFQRNGSLKLILSGPDDNPIRIEATTDFSNGSSWVPVATNPPGQFIFTIPNSSLYSRRYYRAAIMP